MSKCPGPCENEMVFDGRGTMRASDLKVLELLDFRVAEGVIAFHDQRMLLYDGDGLGNPRRELAEAVGSRGWRETGGSRPRSSGRTATRRSSISAPGGRPPSPCAGSSRGTGAATSRPA